MMTDSVLRLASQVGYQDVRDYLKSRGWTASPSRRSYTAIYRSPADGAVEVLVPLDRDLGDYAEAMSLVANGVGDFEKRDTSHVLRDLLQPKRDTLRFALDGSGTTMGVIGISEGSNLLNGVKKALLASACGAQRPRKYHPRMSLGDAEAYLRACTLGQTEVGSFVLTVDAPHEVAQQLTAAEPFGRRATEHLLKSTALLVESVRKGDFDPLLEVPDEEACVSANLCESILEMLPADQSADLRLRSSWSPLLPLPTVPSAVTIDRSMYFAIEEIGQKLRPADGPKADLFVGSVLELSGSLGPSGAIEGEVTLYVWHDETLIKAKASLSANDYRLAATAHLENQFVLVRGVLHRGRRTNQVKDVTQFTLAGK